MQIKDLISADVILATGNADAQLTGVTADSRQVAPGMLFVALAGTQTDGSRFISEAVAKGAGAILSATVALPGEFSEQDFKLVDPLAAAPALLVSHEPRQALAKIAALFYPRQPQYVVAITGTNGKTSVADFTRQLLSALGCQAASLGTIGVVKPSGAIYGSLTTPDPITLHQTLDGLAGEGVTHLAMEASSHGLDQFRLDGVRLAAGAFLNLGRDHLDYHPDIQHYLNAKLGLFTRLLTRCSPAIVNADAPYADAAIAAAKSYGRDLLTIGRKGTLLRLAGVERDGFKQRLSVVHGGRTYKVHLGLIGDYQASNALVAAAFAIVLGEDPSLAIRALEVLEGVSGRLEVVGQARGGLAVVDYAHKPEALSAALTALRPFVTGRLICVMGCGGNRDSGKRPIMGQIAADLADAVIVTDDNPRFEVAADIRKAVLAGIPAGTAGVHEIGDRGAAIAHAISGMGAGDVVLIAGKGHETGQIIGAETVPFSDQAAAKAALAAT